MDNQDVAVKDEPVSDEVCIKYEESELETIDNIKKFIQQTGKTHLQKNAAFLTNNLCETPTKSDLSLTSQSMQVNSKLAQTGNDEETIAAQPETITIVYEDDDQSSEYRIIIEPDQVITVADLWSDVKTEKQEADDEHKCLKCSRSFKSLGQLQRHNRLVHQRKRKTFWKIPANFVKGKKVFRGEKAKRVVRKRTAKKDTVSPKSKFRCNRCHIHYNTFEELTCHRGTSEHNTSILCDICNQAFKYKYLMRLHRNNHVKTDQRLFVDYRCIPCQISVNTFPKVLLHYEDKHSNDRKCILCGMVVRQGYKKHLKSHRKRVYKCLPCDKLFSSNNELIKHYHSEEHKEMKRCKLCDEFFPNPARVRMHMLTYHKVGRLLQCELCGITCSTIAALNRHKKRKHMTDQMILCEFCGKAFFTRKAVTNHVIEVHVNKPNVCYICLKEFREEDELVSHYLEHSEHPTLNSTYSCESCSLEFNSECETFDHILGTHYMYACYKCMKLFMQKRGLKYHLVTHEYSQNIEVTQEGVVCLVCNKTFKYKSSLRYHMYCHTGEKPYECGVCKKIFRKPYHVKLHMRTHTKERPYSCEKCQKTFTSKPAIKYHLTQVHSTDPTLHQCSVCLRKFKSEFLCKGHIARMHSEGVLKSPNVAKDEILDVRLPVREPKPKPKFQEYKCEFCIRTFKSENACWNHTKKYHPQESKDLEEIDIKEILDPRRKDCLYCHRYFKSDSAFNNHMARAHPQYVVQEVEEEEQIEQMYEVGNTVDEVDLCEEDEDEPMEIVLDETVENILRQNGGVIIQEYVEDSDED